MRGNYEQQEKTNASGLIYGNKMPIEILLQHGWEDGDIVNLVEKYLIINTFRQHTIYCDRMVKSNMVDYMTAVDRWDLNNLIYYAMLERAPVRVLRIAFSDLCLRPEIEVLRMFDFLGIDKSKVKHCLDAGPKNIRLYPQHDKVLRHKAF